MKTAKEIALYFIETCSVDNLKLQKLLYYCQAMSLFLNDEPIFKDEIQAWAYGPVVPNVYHEYKTNNFNTIDNISITLPKYSTEELKAMDETLSCYSSYTGPELINETHSELPWKQAYENGQNSVITIESIREFAKDNYTVE